MQSNASQLKSAPDPEQKTRLELDRKVFFLETLLETSRELNGLIQPRRIMDAFLLMTMGSLGAADGLVLLFNTRSRHAHLVHRGIPPAEAEHIEQNIWSIYELYYTEERPSGPSTSMPKLITHDSLPEYSPLPGRMEAMIIWDIDQEYSGLVGLGKKISGEPFEEDDYSLLLNLGNVLVSALAHALFTKNIEHLNADLYKKNVGLKESLGQAERARRDLQRKVHHLKSLYELTAELSPLIDSDQLLESFLLTVMGTFGVSRGFALVCERTARRVRMVSRGPARQPHMSADEADRLLYRCLDSAENRALEPMTVTRLNDPELLFEQIMPGAAVQTAIMLVIDRSHMSLVGLGPTLSGLPLSGEDEELLRAQAAGFMVFLKNARSFEAVQCLNQELSEANQELRQTIADLTEARHTIKVLEKAKATLKSIVQREADRIGRVSLLDFSLILLAALVLGFSFNLANPNGIPILPKSMLIAPVAGIDAADARRLQEAGLAVIVDARPPEIYSQEHIADAVNVPATLFEIVFKMKLARLLTPQTTVVVYGRNISKRYDELVAYQLLARDHEQVRILTEGMDSWKRQGFPVRP